MAPWGPRGFLLLAVLLFLASARSGGAARPGEAGHDPVEVKVALVAKCLQHVEWPVSTSPEFRLGLLGADEATNGMFREMARHVEPNGKPVRILSLSGIEDIPGLDALYAGEAFAGMGQQIWKAIEKRRIFLVSDRFPDRKYVMLNLTLDHDKENVTFEINRANAAIEGFFLKPDLMLAGGSEIDVRALYRKMRNDLALQEDNVRKKQALLDRLSGQADSMHRQIDRYAGSISGMENVIRDSERRIAGQEARQKTLDQRIAVQREILEAKSLELERQDRTLSAQKTEIRDQGLRISRQTNLIFLMVGATLVLMALGGAVFAAYRFKREANESLERKVLQRTEELETAFRKQRDLEANLQQSEKLKSIGQLAGGIAHDFNNQLGGIMGYADMLGEMLGSNADLRSYTDNIINLVKRSKDLTSQLLAFARKGQSQIIPVDMHAIVREVAGLLERTMGKGIRVRKALCDGKAFTMGDPSQLQNAILNLAINARDAMPEGGELSLSTEILQVIPGGAGPDYEGIGGGMFVRVSVGDTGTGIDAETMKHIFEPFFTTKPVGKGTGMGLAAVFGTAQAHKGFIKVDSELGAGSTFSIFLPLLVQPVPAGGPIETQPLPSAHPAVSRTQQEIPR